MRPGDWAAAVADRSLRFRRARPGFGLLEVVLALAVAGMVLAAVTEVAGRVLIGWSAGFTAFARLERADLALARLTRDLDGLLPIPFDEPRDRSTLFVGTQSGLAFATVAPVSGSQTGVVVVDYRVVAAADGNRLIRSFRRPGSDRVERNVLLSSPATIRFAYVDAGFRRRDVWQRPGTVPRAVVVALKGSPGEGGRPVELSLPIPVRLSIACAAARVRSAQPADTEKETPSPEASPQVSGGGDPGPEAEAEATERPPAPAYCGGSGRPAVSPADGAGEGGGRNR